MRFRCDNSAAEYDNISFLSLLRENGITYEPSAPYTQNQSGVSERMNRRILEKARTMLLEACLPEGFWAEAVNTAVYCRPLHWGLGLGDSSLNPVEPPMVITYIIVLSRLWVDDGKSLIDAGYGQKIYICTKTLHYLSQRVPPTQTNNALNQQIPGTVLWLHNAEIRRQGGMVPPIAHPAFGRGSLSLRNSERGRGLLPSTASTSFHSSVP